MDVELVRRGLVPDQATAIELIEAGRVLVAGSVAVNPSRQVSPNEPLVVRDPAAPYVSRGGEKLAGALDTFGIEVTGAVVLDAGASTGGFTDCLLQRGAAKVFAVDVGYGQLHDRVARDPRVEVIDRTHIRQLDASLVAPVAIVVADLSFISLTRVIDALLAPCGPGAQLVLLVKPQFEAAKADVDRGRGVVTDPEVWRRALLDVTAAVDRAGATVEGLMVSPITGAEGNTEFLAHLRAPDPDRPASQVPSFDPEAAVAAMVDAAVASAAGRLDRA